MRKEPTRENSHEPTRSTLYRRLAAGTLQRVMPGVMIGAAEMLTAERLMSLLNGQQPAAAMNLISALHHYDMTTQIPDALSVALPRGVRIPRVHGFPVQVWYTTPKLLEGCIVEARCKYGAFRVTTPERTVVDCFKYRNKIGLAIFLEALKMSHDRLNPSLLHAEAQRLRVLRGMLPYLKPYYS
ncbi:MAG: type IV toxin-antitoxin system AbiEi family antitoxin [Akkermansia sp.]|nr:type IV toxin-antitoxin system AbiEi family antitoxin [Akkermansia sp.]